MADRADAGSGDPDAELACLATINRAPVDQGVLRIGAGLGAGGIMSQFQSLQWLMGAVPSRTMPISEPRLARLAAIEPETTAGRAS